MDTLNLAVLVNLSGRSGETLAAAVSNLEGRHPNRFVHFANLDFDGLGNGTWTDDTVAQLRTDVENGARGLKIFKNLGFTVTDTDGERVAVDDPRLDPIWALCGKLGIPVLIHSADPAPFWKPRDERNERWLELKQRPGRYRDPAVYPSFDEIMNEQFNVFKKHPETTFISAHMAWHANDLGRLGSLLDEMPNMVVEFGAVIAELGRQPRFARAFFIDYQDRILFGKDLWRPSEYPYFFRVFESDDEYFDYYRKRHAFWKLYGLNLPDDVLKKVYYKNALGIIPGLDPADFPE